MTKTDVVATLAALGITPSRKLGQNFMIDMNLLAALVRQAAPQAGERLLEIGPGLGILTDGLLAAGAQVTAVELDRRLNEHLRKRFADTANFRLIEGDACDQDYTALMGPEPYRCIANLPYSVSTIVIMRLLEAANPPTEMFILLQREMALRLAGRPREPDYGAVSVQVQWMYAVEIVRRVSPGVFFPSPEVESAFTRLARRPQPLVAPDLYPQAREVVRQGFSQRRKQMFKLLAARWPADRIRAAYAALNIPADARAESLSPAAFAALARQITAA